MKKKTEGILYMNNDSQAMFLITMATISNISALCGMTLAYKHYSEESRDYRNTPKEQCLTALAAILLISTTLLNGIMLREYLHENQKNTTALTY